MTPYTQTRRHFLKTALKGVMGTGLLGSSQIAFMNQSFASTTNDYKALVGIFLYGGNDSFNMLIPLSGDTLSGYQQIRTHLVQPNPLAILPSTPVTDGIGLAQSLGALQPLFSQGKLAIQAKVGTLIEPYIEGAQKPLALLSHSNQQDAWQRGAELNQGNVGGTGWAGRVLETLMLNSSQGHLLNMSLQGRNLWQAGNLHSPYSLSTKGVEMLEGFTSYGLESRRAPIMEQYLSQTSHSHKIMEHFRKAMLSTKSTGELLSAQLAALDNAGTDELFPSNNSLANQLKTVLDLIRLGKEQQVNRQIFLVGLGGFDTHNSQFNRHNSLLEELSTAMSGFYTATEQLGFSEQVTSFTMSDFGRSRTPNNSGTDHGWAGHQLILGGSVRGDLYGELPTWSTGIEGDSDWIPSTANEQMFASLANWFGVSESDCFNVFPNLQNFGSTLDVNYFTS